MANYTNLKTAIQQVIRTNGNEEITGALLQQSLLSMINSLGAGYQFMGIATPSTNPGTPDQKVFYIASPGEYANFDNAVIKNGNVGILKYDTQWSVELFSDNITLNSADVNLYPIPYYIGPASTLAPNPTSKTIRREVIEGKKYLLYAPQNISSASYYCFYTDEAGRIPVGTRVQVSVGNQIIVAPATAKYLMVCTQFVGDGDYKLYSLVEYNTLFEELDSKIDEVDSKIDSKIDEVNSKIDDVSETVSPNLYNGTTINGVIDTAGRISNVGSINKSTNKIPVLPNSFYYLSGRNGDIESLRCIGENDAISRVRVASTGAEPDVNIRYYLPKEDGSGSQSNGQFKTSPDAKYVQISIGMNYGDNSRLQLEYVGTEYNASFVPSPYKPYDNTIVLKEEKLPPDVLNKLDNIPAPNVLLIGSSHGMNTISQLPWIFYRGGYKNTKVGNVYVGSFMIQELAERIFYNMDLPLKTWENGAWDNGNSLKMSSILNKEWDVIVLQRSASADTTWTSAQSDSFRYCLDYITSYCKSNNLKTPRILFNSGFADASATDTPAIMNSAKQMKTEYGIDIVPTAMALANARTTWLNTIGAYSGHYLCYDSQHLDYGIGCWVASACLFEAVMRPLGRSIETCSGYGTQEEQYLFNSSATPTNYTEPTEKMMRIAKDSVMSAFNDDANINTLLATKYQYKNRVTVVAPWITVGGADAEKRCLADGASFNITLTPWTSSSYVVTIVEVKVIMNGLDITTTAYNPTTKSVNINSVNGDVEVFVKHQRI